MELLVFAIILAALGGLAQILGADSRPANHDAGAGWLVGWHDLPPTR
jgi:hypothetical protein